MQGRTQQQASPVSLLKEVEVERHLNLNLKNKQKKNKPVVVVVARTRVLQAFLFVVVLWVCFLVVLCDFGLYCHKCPEYVIQHFKTTFPIFLGVQ